jgi:hypothetical protein
MDLELKHLGQTLAIGGLTIYGLFQLISLHKPSWTSSLTFLSTGGQKLHESAMILAVVFAAGILMEDVSKNYTAERSSWGFSVFNTLVDSDKQLRLKSLFGVKSYSPDSMTVKPDPLYEDLMSVNRKDTRFEAHRATLSKILECSSLNDKGYKVINSQTQALEGAVNGIYYSAKNRVYQEGNFFNELRGIEYRAGFARALTFLCVFYSACYLVSGILSFLPGGLRLERLPRQLSLPLESQKPHKIRTRLKVSRWLLASEVRTKRRVILLMFTIYLIGVFLAGISYRSEMVNYNLRVFGYYILLTSNGGASK